MAAPTPVSAYLHSATMVKAGVYLIRLGDARRRLLLAAWLTAVWLALWGELDPLTALGGAALALGLVALFTPDRWFRSSSL